MASELASWNDGTAKQTILDFLDRVTEVGGERFVAPEDRIAVLDNDGTLWCERPAYIQAVFLVSQLAEQAKRRPELAQRPIAKALLAGDLKGAMAEGLGPLADTLLGVHAGLSVEEFNALVTAWFEHAAHPRFGTPLLEVVYAPMLELLELLRARDFQVFVATAGGADFLRAVSSRLYGVSPGAVIGSAVGVDFVRRDGRAVLIRQDKVLGSANEGPAKPVTIQEHIGRRPIFAAGNSSGDLEMLEYVSTGELPSLCVVVDHDDEQREYAYAGGSETNPNAEPILDAATRHGWTVVSMREDWQRVFANQPPSA